MGNDTSPPGDGETEEADVPTTTWTHPMDYVHRRRWTRVEGPAAATTLPIHLHRIA